MLRLGLVLLLLSAAAGCAICSPIQISIVPSIAPNSFGGAAWPGYVVNALTAFEACQLTAGDPSLPSYYAAQTTPVEATDLVVTGFPSWLGQADPGDVFGAAFANEYGSRLHFGVVMNGNGAKFSISELTFTETSNDPANLLGFRFAPGSYNYSTNYVGIIDSVNGPTYITGGPNTQLVDRVVGRGSGNGVAVYCPACTVEQERLAILDALPAFDGMTKLTGTYSLLDASGEVLASASSWVDLEAVPEPGGMALVLVGLALIGMGVVAFAGGRLRGDERVPAGNASRAGYHSFSIRITGRTAPLARGSSIRSLPAKPRA